MHHYFREASLLGAYLSLRFFYIYVSFQFENICKLLCYTHIEFTMELHDELLRLK